MLPASRFCDYATERGGHHGAAWGCCARLLATGKEVTHKSFEPESSSLPPEITLCSVSHNKMERGGIRSGM